ncbi:4301_t:CDS:2, partial [Rhizophagus irregularis]
FSRSANREYVLTQFIIVIFPIFIIVFRPGLLKENIDVEKLPLLGRPRISNFNDLKYLEVLLKERDDWYLYELQSEMELWM